MRYMLIRKADAETESGALPTEKNLQAMADYNQRLMRAGILEGGDGLRPSREGCRIEFRDGEVLVTDGPFAETRELIAGYTVLNVGSLEEAVHWARQWPPTDGDGNVTLELRPYFTMEDFLPGAAVEQHRAMGEQLARLPKDMNVHVAFPGTCREAMGQYAEVTDGHLEAVITFGETPAAADVPSEWHDKVIHASLNIRGRRLLGADMVGDCYESPRGAKIHLEYPDAERAEAVFNRLADGGTVLMPFEETFFASRFGMTTDRFGIGWMISSGIQHCLEGQEEGAS